MEEVLTRRFRRYLRERDEGAQPGKRFAYPPNLLLIDGGKGSSASRCGCSRSSASRTSAWRAWPSGSKRCTCPGEPEPVRIPRDSEALYLLQQVRDEAHRFAITYHRQLRGKEMTKSVLDDVPGPRARPAASGCSRSSARSSGCGRSTEDELVAIPGCPTRSAHATATRSCHGEPRPTAGRRR